MRSDIAPGGAFPDYEPPDHTGARRRLGALQGEDPLILTLARGHYCPKEYQQHLELAAFHPKIAVASTQIATIATDNRPPHAPGIPRVGRRTMALSLRPGPDRPERPRHQGIHRPRARPHDPRTFVLKPGLMIHSIYNGYWFWGWPSIADLWRDLRAVTREIRPDWDLSAPGLREKWDAGDHSPFHGWNKRRR